MAPFCAVLTYAGGTVPHGYAQFPGSQQPAQALDEAIVLEPGKPIERELAGGERHKYQIALTEGQYMRVEIREKGISIGATFQLADGTTTHPWAPFGGGRETKAIGQVAESPGTYRLEVYAVAKAPIGRYEIELAILRPATETDLALHQARKLFVEYIRIRDQVGWIEARPLLIRSLEIRERVLGPDDLLVATAIGFLANSYDYTGDYASAEPLALRALKIREKALGPDHPDLAHDLSQIGIDYQYRGDYFKAEEMQQRAWSILERAQQTGTADAAGVLESLARTYYARGDYQRAEEYSQRSRAVWEKLLGPDHFHLAPSFTFLGRVAYDALDYSKAEAMFQRALTLSERALGQDHLGVTTYVNDLAMVYCTTGRYAEGEALYRRALAVHEQKAAMSYPEARETLYGLARCFAAEGNATEAVKFQLRASEIEERFLATNLAAGSEREKQAFVTSLSSRSSRNISLHTRLDPDDPVALHLAVTTILQRKGRVQDAVSTNLSALRQRFGAEDQKLLDRWNALISEFAKVALTGPQKVPASEYAEQIKVLEERRETLEAEMNRRSSGFYQGTKPTTLAAIETAIPENAALIEFAVYRAFDPKAQDNDKAYGQLRYAVYVVRCRGEVQWEELGEANSIDEAINRLRQALRDPQRKDVRQLARALDQKVMQPIRALIGNATHLLVSPDGQLDLIPFEALIDEQGRYEVERYSITYLTTGRDLPRMQVARESKSESLVIADPLFGEPDGARIAEAGRTKAKLARSITARRSITTGEDLSTVYFAPLGGTVQEARTIKLLFPEARVLTGQRATKTALKQAEAPRLLHIATHGFFLLDAANSTAPDSPKPGASGTRAIIASAKIENPLLRSGLALTGANLNKGGGDDGILTALEASNLNLWGTKLVTLSACDTGVGQVKNGEGVYGLRRALFLAGTESLVMSLWPVSDYVTRELMIEYYAGLKRGVGRGEALRQAQLAMLKRKSRHHPFYWASFIESGEWANLDGHR
ncbi:MAG TPA: CHAT domain-containing tetratricopeptide repeat protein [Candidatus Acidoferrum sp.]|nr:CHAT domain-containing tetratricopeptide repeat protein [Candidatus Acidoferrum sp.]